MKTLAKRFGLAVGP